MGGHSDRTRGSKPQAPGWLDGLARVPAAAGSAARAGVPDAELARAVNGLRRGGVGLSQVVGTLHALERASRHAADVSGIGRFVESRVAAGARGENLARQIHARLQRSGIPAGIGWDGMRESLWRVASDPALARAYADGFDRTAPPIPR